MLQLIAIMSVLFIVVSTISLTLNTIPSFQSHEKHGTNNTTVATDNVHLAAIEAGNTRHLNHLKLYFNNSTCFDIGVLFVSNLCLDSLPSLELIVEIVIYNQLQRPSNPNFPLVFNTHIT